MRLSALSFVVAAVAVGTLGLAPEVRAQETTGTILGTVTDSTGAVLPGVTIVVKNTRTGQTLERVSNEEGLYLAPLLPVGSYEITFTLNGFQQRVVRGVTVAVNDRLVVDAAMVVGGVTEIVEVTSVESVQPTAALQTIGSEQVQELPISNRNFAQLASLRPACRTT